MDFKCPKCDHYGFEWDGRAKVMRCPYITCDFVCSVPLPTGLDSWRHGSPTDSEKYNACLFAKAALTGDMYMVPDPGFENTWANYLYAVNVVRRANNFPALTNDQCFGLGDTLLCVLLKGAVSYTQLKENLAEAAVEFGKRDWPEEDRKRGYVLGDDDD